MVVTAALTMAVTIALTMSFMSSIVTIVLMRSNNCKKTDDSNLVGYTDAGYLSDSHNARSQTGFVFLHGGTAIS